MTTLRRPTPPPQLAMLPPKALPAGLPKSLRPSKFPPKNLDELDPLQQVTKEPGTGLLGKCVLCLLLNAVFVLALFLAFLIGHFASEAHLPRSNKTNNHSTSSSLSSGAVGPTPLTRLRAHAATTNSITTSSGTNNHDGGIV
uniref:Uncharacterized protein n=1 Tax=Globodera pallida TaxID=36090 RepID=A0A183BWZ0_GLOPA